MQVNPLIKKPTTPILIPTHRATPGRLGARPGKTMDSPGRPVEPVRRVNNTPVTPQPLRAETNIPTNDTTAGSNNTPNTKLDTLPKAVATKPSEMAAKKYEPRIYSDDDIREMTSNGYIIVHPGMWEYLPKAAHIRFLKKDDGSGKCRGERFKAGGFVRNHYISEAGHRMMILESRVDGKRNEFGYKTFPVCLNDIEVIWKEYCTQAFIEIHLMFNSLAQKKQQIAELAAQNADLTTRVTRLENILRSVIK